jgi:glycosyltransferase 2 family protein
MKSIRIIAASTGLVVAAGLVWEIGPMALIAEVRQLSWRLGLLMLPQGLVSLVDAAGWRYAFPRRLPPLVAALGARLAGEAINDTTPTGTLGGEPLKAWLVARGGIPFEEGLASAVVAKTALVASQLGFLALGLGLAVWRLRPGSALVSFMGLLLAVGAVAIGGFIWAQRHGLFGRSRRVLAWIGIDAGPRLERLDAELRRFYRSRRARFSLTLACHFLGWLCGGIEVWLALRFFGRPVGAATAIVIEGFVTAVRSASFLVPASIGLQGGGLVAIFVSCGLPASVGLAFGLVRRIREAVWAAIGYAVLALWRGARAA